MPQPGPNTQYARAPLGRAARAPAGRPPGLALLSGSAARPRSRLGRVSHAPGNARARSVAAGPGGGRLARRCLRGAAEVERMADGAVEGPARARLARARRDGHAARGHRSRRRRLRLELQPVRWALRLLDDASDSLTALCVVRARGRPLARRPARGLGVAAGRAAGRWAPAAPSTSARARRRRSRASFTRSGGSSRTRSRSRRCVGAAQRHEDAGRARHGPGRLRRPCPTPSTTSGPGGPPTSTAGPPRRTSGSS